uniref:non-specific serine/threonine protein kinase n=1 Tax=Astyanax mexicanus TaxID=7994 RepID=A0A8B9H272_ASTMX
MEQYSVVRVIGTGSFGRALLVQTEGRGEKWVMKEIRLPKAESGMRTTRREAVLLAKMKHSNIVAFRESFEDDGHLFIVMEFCSGGDLLQRIRQQKGSLFSEDVILKWFSQMCLGTKHIHDKRVLHRDLKSKNIFLTEHGTIKLGDFGSACTLNSARAYAQTYVGTPYYVSPEIWDNQPYNNKSDVWSLGCVLYELCTLHHPFQSRSWKNLILKVCRGSYAPLPRHLPYELHYLIKHMFKTNPRDRPSIHTILNSHRVSRLLLKHLPEEVQNYFQTRQSYRIHGPSAPVFILLHSRFNSNIARFYYSSRSSNVSSLPESQSGDVGSRKKWAKGPSNTVLEVLANADIISSVGLGSSEGSDCRSGTVALL